MNESKALASLINALSKSEKRYFQVFARTSKADSHLLQLFDAIDKQKLHTDAELKAHFSTTAARKHLDVRKVHLQSLILKSMRLYHAGRTQNKMIKDMIADMHFYYGKALYPECEKLIRKTKKLIMASGDFHLMFEIIDMERELLTVGRYATNTDEQTENQYKEEIAILRKMEDEINIKNMCDKATATNKQYGLSRNEKEYQLLQQMIAHPYLDEKNAHTFRSRRLIYFAKSVFYFTANEYETAEVFIDKLIALHEENISIMREKPLPYLSAITNCAIVNIRLKHYDNALALIKKMRHIPNLLTSSARHSKDLHQRIDITSGMFEFVIHIERAHIGEAEKIFPAYRAMVEQYKNVMPLYRLVEMKFSMLTFYFMKGDYDAALEMLIELESMKLDKHKHDIFSMMRILKLIVHFELKHFNLLPYFIKSTYHALLKDNRLFRFEQVFLEFLRKDMPRSTSNKQLIESFKKLKATFDEIESDPYEKSVFISFDIIAWLDSKINHTKFIDEVKKKLFETP